MLNITNIPAPRVNFIDPRTGLMSREWYRFFLNIFTLVGGGNNATTLEELQYGPPNNDQFVLDLQNLTEVNTTDSALVSQSTEMQKQLEALKTQSQPQLGTMAPINIDWVPYIGFDTAPPWIGTTAGQFWFNSATGSFNAKMGNNNITQQVGEEFFSYGKASASISDVNLQLVYKTGTVGASGVITFAPTIAGLTRADQILGIATEPLATNNFGRITTSGVVRNINTSGSAYSEVWADNDDIWYNPVTGGLTKTEPVAPNMKLKVGTIISAGSGGSGSFFVNFGAASTLGGTDSNVQFSAEAAGNVIVYNGSYWKNESGIGGGTF